MEFKDLIIPTMNVNDTTVTISDIRKENLEYIEEGEVLYSVETSKATEEYKCDFAGYVVLFVEDMDEVEVGKSAGMIFKSLDDAKAKLAEVEETKQKAKGRADHIGNPPAVCENRQPDQSQQQINKYCQCAAARPQKQSGHQ